MSKNVSIILIVLVIIIGAWVFKSKDNNDTLVNPSVVTSGENPEPGGIHDMPVEPAAAKARKDLATKLAVDEKSIVIMKVEEGEWSDGCLGLGGPAESCLQVITPGFRVEMLAKGKTYIYRADKSGEAVRMEAQ